MFFSKNKTFPSLHLHNSATGKKELFTPLKKNVVTMYACGPTVYNHIHIGNLRAYLLPDLLHRVFLYNGYQVKLTINFTDFGHLTDDGDAGEDKIMKGMTAAGLPITLEAMRNFVVPFIDSFKNDNNAFGNLPATNYTRASDYIREQIKLVETLFQKGYAYETSDGVYFDITKYPEYGTLGNVNLEEMKAGARVEVNTEKNHPADFALWKKGELGWNSKWGQGFPGWHIECTAMAFATLGKTIDVHTGGEDLMYTHHNGEIAQAKCATGRNYVNYWVHNAHITIAEQKIAKSSGNGLTLQELADRGYSPADYRYWLLTSHYRTTANFSFEALDSSKQALMRLKRFVYEELGDIRGSRLNEKYQRTFMTAIHDDLDTPGAIATVWELVKDQTVSPESKLATIHDFDAILELGLSLPSKEGMASMGFLQNTEVPEEVQTLIQQREEARAEKNWAEADRLRDLITNMGYNITDESNGVTITKG